ncbi:hypothetical protein L3X38_027096 [Prunus dulcis]|uniref:Uncharacterized protein n=1 Tax=Prunus dulcis TaxID=3755 RepID=A0AAD4Z014_PRUDU|nr:hypothetical protein L3X38_027096 [Prunus dulcis]
MTTYSSWIDHSSVAIVESNEVTRNNTNVTDVGGDVGTYFTDMIDFSKVKKMHGGHNDIEINEVLVYSPPPILGLLDTSAQLPIMRLESALEPTIQHNLSSSHSLLNFFQTPSHISNTHSPTSLPSRLNGVYHGPAYSNNATVRKDEKYNTNIMTLFAIVGITCDISRLALVDIDLKDRVEFEGFSTDLALEVVNDEFFVCWMAYEAWSQNVFDIAAGGGLGAKTETGGGCGVLRDRVVVVAEN